MQYIDIVLSHYGWAGSVLIVMLLVALSLQVAYYSFHFARIGKFLIKNRPVLHETPPPVSLVIPMFSEDYDYLDDTLPELLSQENVCFEIVIVYVGCDNDFFEDMLHLKGMLPNLKITKIERNERFPISVKTALNVGIKAAQYEHIVFSTTDACPTSKRWLSLMARGFQRGDVVMGYCGVDTIDNKFDSYFIRACRFMDSMFWLSKAISKRPYRAIRHNMGFTRSLYFGVNGFNRLNMNIGEDDLFMQNIMKQDNASVVLSPRASVMQRNWGRLDGLVDTMRFYGSAQRFYPAYARNYVAWELASRVLFFLLSLAALIFLPLELKAATLIFIILRIILMLTAVKKVAERVGEKGMVGRYLLFDMLSPLFSLYMWFKMLKRDKRVWR